MLKTVAALPRRPAAPSPSAASRVMPPRPSAAPVRFDHKGDANQAFAAVGWTTFGGFERIRERRALGVAGNIVQVRLLERLRDLEGATYSPSAGATASEIFPAWGMFYAGAEVRPERTDLFFRLAREVVADLAAKPPEADEWARAINPVLAGIERRVKTNGYWAGAMEDWSRRPALIEQTRTYLSDYRSMTPEAVQAAMKTWVADEGDWSMVILPAKAAGGVK
jgi:zinc protease